MCFAQREALRCTSRIGFYRLRRNGCKRLVHSYVAFNEAVQVFCYVSLGMDTVVNGEDAVSCFFLGFACVLLALEVVANGFSMTFYNFLRSMHCISFQMLVLYCSFLAFRCVPGGGAEKGS